MVTTNEFRLSDAVALPNEVEAPHPDAVALPNEVEAPHNEAEAPQCDAVALPNEVEAPQLKNINKEIRKLIKLQKYLRRQQRIQKRAEKLTQSMKNSVKLDLPKVESAGQESVLNQEENTTFTDQRETVSDQGYITSQELVNLQQYSMPEEEWHVRNIMAKPIPFYSGNWSTSDTLGKILKDWKVPGDTLYGPHYNLVSTFTFFRGHPIIRFQLNGTKFHAGRLIVAFIPYYDFAQHEDALYTVSTLTSMPHVILDAGIANSGVLELPFVHINTYFNSISDQKPWQSLGRLVCAVYNRLRAADSSSQSVGITAWISYKNCELHQPCFAHDVKFPKIAGDSSSGVPQVESLVEGVLKSAIPLVKDLITPEMTSIGNVLGGSSDQDKPTDPIEISRWVPNVVTGMTRGDGIDRCDRWCLKAGGYTVPDADLISTTQDDMNLLELCKIPTRLDFVDWKIEQGTGTRLMHIPVCPNVVENVTRESTTTPAVSTISPTLIGYVSRGFKYWRGGLRYKVQMIASQMHTGRLLVSFGAGLTLLDSDFAKASYLNTYVIDLQEKHEVEFIVPYMAERPWLRCDRSRLRAGTGDTGDRAEFEQTGYLDIFVLNPLVRPESVSSTISINVLVSAADDFELAFPSDFAYFQGIGNVVATAMPKVESLVQQETVTTRTDSGVVTLGKGTGRLAPAGAHTMGEDAMNLKTLLRRYTKAYHNSHQTGNDLQVISFDNTPTLSGVNKCFNNGAGRQFRTTLCHFSELFTFWRGSLRYKLMYKTASKDGDTDALTFRAFHMPGVFNYGSFTPITIDNNIRNSMDAFEAYGVQLAVTQLQGSIEFEVPFYTPYTQLKTIRAGTASARSSTGKIFILAEAPFQVAEQFTSMDLYQAAGDDFTLNYLRAAPKCQYVADEDEGRDMRDTANFLTGDQPVCYSSSAPQVEALTDYVPGVAYAKRSIESMNQATGKLSEACDTANHLMLKAAKKIGLSEKDSEDEEETTTIFEDASKIATQFTSPLIPIVTNLIESLKGLPDSLAGFLKTDISVMDVVLEVATIVSGLTAYNSASGYLQKTLAIITIVSAIVKDISVAIKNQLYHLVTLVVTYFNGSKEGNELPQAQSLDLDLVAPLAASMVIGMGIVGFRKIPTDKETADMCKGMSEKLRLFNFSSLAATNIRRLWNEIKELVQWSMDYIMEKLAPHFFAQLKLDREFEDIEVWTQFIDSLDNVPYTDMIHYDIEFKNKVLRAVDRGVYYNNLLVTGKCGRAASVIREYCRKAVEIGHKCVNSKNELPYRIDPYCVAVYGRSNIGKSGCITTLGYDMMDALGYPHYNRWCAINCSETFFSENYKQQEAVYFDDFGTFTSEEQYNKFMNLKANTALPLNMAFKKGEYFGSKFIFMTTNTPYPDPNFVTNREALLRRRDKLIEADWIDTNPELNNALRLGENMMRFRQLDNSHLRFRILHSVEENAPPGPWMSYQQVAELLTEDARVHMANQQRKVTADLTRAGYIMPQVESGEDRKILMSAIVNSPTLKLFDAAIWPHLQWNQEEKIFEMYVNEEDDDATYLMEQWKEAEEFMNGLGMDLQKQIFLHSYLVKDNETYVSKIRGRISDFKNWLIESVKKIQQDHPWLSIIAKWGLYLTGAIGVAALAYYGTKTVIKKCICVSIRYFGYRCGMCGKWPKMENVRPSRQNWMLSEWEKIYSNLDYQDDHVTTIEEEVALQKITKGTRVVEEITLGTKAVAEGVYSDVTKGSSIGRVVAQTGSYSDVTKGARKTIAVAQSRYTASENLIENRFLPYMYRCKTRGARGMPAQQMNGFAIGDRNMILNAHFFYGMEEGDVFECYHNGAWIEVVYYKDLRIDIPNKDAVIFEMPKSFHQHKDNSRHFLSEKDLPYVQLCGGFLCKLTVNLKNMIVEVPTVKALKRQDTEQATASSTQVYHIQDAWRYNKCTVAGDCGSPLVCGTGNHAGKIIGLHMAGDKQFSYAQLITKEMIEKTIKTKGGTPLPEVEAKFGQLIPPGHLGRIGTALPGEGVFQSPKTEIIETVIHGMIEEPKTFPAVMTINDERLSKRINPLRKAIEKYSYPSKPFPRHHREKINKFMKDEVRNFSLVRADPKPLTEEEMIAGVESIDGMERLPMATSPGYPWIKTRPNGESGKAYLFDLENSRMEKELREKFFEREENAKKGERVLSIWVDCLKDERRLLEKIKTGSTRVFTIPPVDFSLLMRKYTLDFSAAVWNSRSFGDCKVGIDPQSMEWTILYKWLAEFSDLCVAGDFSRFDGSMPAELIDDVRGDIDEFYNYFGQNSEDDRNVRKTLFEEMIHTVHLARDQFYMTHIGNKSGNPITVILNSRINKRYMMLAWLGLAEVVDKKLATTGAFSENVRCAIYGDDNILAIKKEVIDWFNQETISEYLEQFGITYTNEQKTGVTKFKKLDECSFLKQTFHDHESIKSVKVPHMSLTTILELTNWTREAPDQDVLLEDNCSDALRFMYFYGEKKFEELRNKIQKALLEKERRFTLKNYLDYHNWFLNTIEMM